MTFIRNNIYKKYITAALVAYSNQGLIPEIGKSCNCGHSIDKFLRSEIWERKHHRTINSGLNYTQYKFANNLFKYDL